ncbi:MAG: VirB4 family type IV secretion system protein, partial [Anaerovoracaceae bacterium]
MFKIKKEEKKEIVNIDLISKIQPEGGISFSDIKYVQTGAGNEACIYVYEYPKTVNVFWLSELLNIKNAITVLDISTEDMASVKKNINKSISEQRSRFVSDKSQLDKMDAQRMIDELTMMYNEITAMGEIIKLIAVRIYIPGKTLFDVDNNAKDIINHLEGAGYKAVICVNETKNDWRAIFHSYSDNQKNLYRRAGQPMASSTLAAGNPFHFSALTDPHGTYYGTASASNGGSVIYDMFRITAQRLSYNSIIVGKMGSGKSTTLKKLMLERAIRGDFIRAFDVANEFTTLCKYLGGKVISLDGSGQNRINALEILKTDENDTISYTHHLSKVTSIYKYLAPNADDGEILELEILLRHLYVQVGIINPSDIELKGITGRAPTDYPIFSDLLNLIANYKSGLEENMETNRFKLEFVNRIEMVIKSIVTNYGNIFDGHTTLINLYDEKIVVFDIQKLAGSKSEIFDSQLFIALALCWDNCVVNGSKMKNLYDNKQIDWEDITRFLVIIDESHRIVNTSKVAGAEQITLYCREARKFFGGIALASQSIRDFVPD